MKNVKAKGRRHEVLWHTESGEPKIIRRHKTDKFEDRVNKGEVAASDL